MGNAEFRLATVHPEDKSQLLKGIDALSKERSEPIRLTPIPTTCRMLPLSRI